ncbi:formate dehydrogenase accessory sulfurtransferase FdhD [Thermodesulfobacteriota bacterium]
MDRAESTKVINYRDETFAEEETSVVREIPLAIFVCGHEIISLLTIPDDLENLAIGFLYLEGLIQGLEEVRSIELDETRGVVNVDMIHGEEAAEFLARKRTITSGCGKGTTFHNVLDTFSCLRISSGQILNPNRIFALFDALNERSLLYRKTRCVHNVALCTNEEVLIFREDIGRHNALDKICGESLRKGLDTGDKVIVTTGRVTSEIVIKVGRMGIPIILSRSSPSSQALSLADSAGITIVGRIRRGKFTVFSHPERIAGTGEGRGPRSGRQEACGAQTSINRGRTQ